MKTIMTAGEAKQVLDKMRDRNVGAIWLGRWIWPDDLRQIIRGEVGCPTLYWSPSLNDFTIVQEVK